MNLPDFIKKGNTIIITCDSDSTEEGLYEGKVLVWPEAIVLIEYREYHSMGCYTNYSPQFSISDYGKTWTAYEVL